MRRDDERTDRRGVERRPRRAARLVDDLDIVRSLGEARRDPRIGLAGGCQRRYGQAVLGAVAAGHGGEDARCIDVRRAAVLAARHAAAHRRGRRDGGEHVELCRDAEQQRVVLALEGVDVRVDQSGEQGLARAVDDARPRRRGPAEVRIGDLAVGDQHVARGEALDPVEYRDVPDHGRRRGGGSGGRCEQGGGERADQHGWLFPGGVHTLPAACCRRNTQLRAARRRPSPRPHRCSGCAASPRSGCRSRRECAAAARPHYRLGRNAD